MANAIYPKYKEKLLGTDGTTADGANTALTSNPIRVSLIDTGNYTYSASHQYVSDVGSDGVNHRWIANSAPLTTKTVTNGTFNADDVTFTSVTGSNTAGALIIWHEGGATTNSNLIAYLDTGVTGLPVTPNGGDITVTWNASGIFTL
jgi:hypothetical protein